MALTATLTFKDSQSKTPSGIKVDTYMVTDVKCRVSRPHNDERPDGHALCDSLELTLIVPDRGDTTLYQWYIGQSFMSGSLAIELPDESQGISVYKTISFENAVCYSLAEEYHINLGQRRSMHLGIVAGELKIDTVTVKTDLICQT